MYGPQGRTLNFNVAWCKAVQSQVSILKHSKKMYHEHENMTFLLNATYTNILIYIEKKLKKMFGPGPTGPYGSYAYDIDVWELCSVISNDSALTLSFGIIVYHPLVRLSHHMVWSGSCLGIRRTGQLGWRGPCSRVPTWTRVHRRAGRYFELIGE